MTTWPQRDWRDLTIEQFVAQLRVGVAVAILPRASRSINAVFAPTASIIRATAFATNSDLCPIGHGRLCQTGRRRRRLIQASMTGADAAAAF